MTKGRYWLIFSLRTVGNFLILASFLWLVYSFYPVVRAEVSYRIDKVRGVERVLTTSEVARSKPPQESFGELLRKPHPLLIEPVSREFGIVIPKINANSLVVPNVDAGNYDEYSQRLLEGVAHAKGTVFPGEQGNSYLFAHSVLNPWEVPRYNAQFWLLDKLEKNDLVFAFYKGKQFDYKVVEKTVVEAGETSYLTASYDEPVLTLQTCTPPGTTWRRLIVVAKLVAGE